MSSLSLRHLRNFWILSVATIVLAGFSDAVAQASYQVTDLGTLHDGYFGCTMGLNNHGWTETQYGLLESGKLVKGRLAINVGGSTLDLGTLGGPNSWDNPFGGEINDRGELVGFPKHLFQTRMAKTFAASAQGLSVVRFFGKTATWALSRRWGEITDRPAP